MMTMIDAGERPGLFARVRNILVRPKAEWESIASEDHAPLIGRYVLPLAALGAIVGLAASIIYGGVLQFNAALIWKVVAAVLYVAFAVVGVMAAALAIRVLAPRFGAETNNEHADRLSAYAATPILVAAFASIAPPVAGTVTAVGVVYALVLLALGMQRLMPLRDPENNVPRFTILFAAVAAAAALLVATIAGPLIQAGREALSGAVQAAVEPRPTQAVTRSAAEEAIERLARADGRAILSDPARLGEQFPDSLPGGFARQSTSSARGGGVSRADATYREGAAVLALSIIQFEANIDAAAFAAQLAVRDDGPEAGGYNRTQTISGRFYAEEVRPSTSRYIVIGRGVVIVVQGGITMDQARATVETIGLQRLEAMFGR